MELVVIFNIFLFIYVLSIRKNMVKELNESTDKLTKMYDRLVYIQDTNQLISESFTNQAQNKVYELSLILLNIKSHYQDTLEMIDDYSQPDLREEILKNIDAVDNHLKEIGFLNNKKKLCSSILEELYFIDNSKFSKN